MKSEARIQQEIVKFYRNSHCLAHHEPRCIIMSVGNAKSIRFHATGQYSGASDLFILHIVNRNSLRVIFAEIKAEGGTLSKAQENFQEHVESMADFLCMFEINKIKVHTVEYHVVRSLEEFKNLIDGNK